MSSYTKNKGTAAYSVGEAMNLGTTPVAVYWDLEAEKEKILNGIEVELAFTNINTEKFFIGSSADLYKRSLNYFNYKYILGYENKSTIYSSIKKMGINRKKNKYNCLGCIKYDILSYNIKHKA